MNLKKSKIALISLLFLLFFIWEIPSSDLPSINKENEFLVRASTVNIEGILNGGFETGEMTYWTVGDTFRIAHVSTGANIAHSGTYGCQIMSYGVGHYWPGSIEQNLTHAEIYSDNVTSFSFWRCTSYDPVRVTVTYWDDTTTFQDFTGSYSWQQHFITGLTAGKRLKKVMFEGTQEGVNHGGIDDISLKFTAEIPITYPPILSEISPNPDTDGDITLDWNDVPYADTYTVYRHSSLITELNGSVTPVAMIIPSTYTELDLIDGTYYYVVTATNETGTSLQSNCKSVVVDLPDLDVEGILNGGFETGEMTYWTVGDTFRIAHVSTGANIAHSGTYGCQIMSYGVGHYWPGSIEQNLTHAEIYSDNVTSFSFWRCTSYDPVRVTVTYWDDTTTFQDFTGAYSWQQHFVSGLTAGKRLKKVMFEGTQEGVNHGGIDDISLIFTAEIPITYPPILSEILPNPDTDGSIALDWNDMPYADTYTVYRHSSLITELNGSVTVVATIISSTYTELGLIDGTYYYVVTATNETGTSLQSNCKSVVVDLPELNAPVLASITPDPDDDGDITLDWDDVPYADNYTIYRYSSLITELNGSVTKVITIIPSTYMDLDLSEGTYYYVVTATNETETSLQSNCKSVVVDLPEPDAPVLASITPDPDDDGDITLDWDDVPYADTYTIYRHSSLITELNGSVTTVATIIPSTYMDLDLSEGTYYYVVTATNETGTSLQSNCKSVVVDLPEPDAPVLASITPDPDDDGDITLDWNDVPSVTLYYVYRFTSYISEYNESITLLGTTTESTYADIGLENGVYYYVIIAENANGLSDISNCEAVQVERFKIPGYSIGIILVMMGSVLAILYYQKFRTIKSN